MLYTFDQWSIQEQMARALYSAERGADEISVWSTDEERMWLEQKGAALPEFYFGLHPAGYNKSLSTSDDVYLARMATALAYYNSTPRETATMVNVWAQAVQQILNTGRKDAFSRQVVWAWRSAFPQFIWQQLAEGQYPTTHSPTTQPLFDLLMNRVEHRSSIRWRPTIVWHGRSNQFHQFMSGLMNPSQQVSTIDGRPVMKKIGPALSITLFINVIALILLLAIGYRLAEWLYLHRHQKRLAWIYSLLIGIHALPLFVIATLLLLFFSTIGSRLVGGVLVLQPGEYPSLSTFLRPANVVYLILPIASIVLAALPVVVTHIYRSYRQSEQSRFYQAAISRGVPQSRIMTWHQRPHATYEIITLVGNSFPSLVSGSIVVEWIFNIPGMGRLMWEALYAYDWNVIYSILILGIIMSIVGQLLADLAYQWIHPQAKLL